ncbi:hypothetical protein TSMEX_002505 [Taenia solium]|eukprot:TsM_000283200 transcript=TsM_000283200 gene=TsM_000283200
MDRRHERTNRLSFFLGARSFPIVPSLFVPLLPPPCVYMMRISFSTAAAYAAASLYLSPPLFHNLASIAIIIIIISVDCFAVVRVHLRLLVVLVVRLRVELYPSPSFRLSASRPSPTLLSSSLPVFLPPPSDVRTYEGNKATCHLKGNKTGI